ncbi:receptor-like protein kinase [Trifolium pratense]|uniref:non-specific serine/threonine protein kinase n=1 Tax=Trifolium pratense TaxID=57577 RepID=A0A2K3M972_TRIPR|nr:receptor-like protein kinase [Trifolium pratense]
MPSLLTILHILQFIILLKLIQIPLYLSSNEGCENLFTCGNITNIGFPFWGANRPKECGYPLLNLTCIKNISYITINDVEYQVLEANPDLQTLRITREDSFQEGLCPPKHVSTTLDTDLFVYGSNYINLTLFYGCPPSITFPSHSGQFQCHSNGYSDDIVYTWFGPNIGPLAFPCQDNMTVPVSNSLFDISNFAKIQSAIKDGFVVRWIAGIEDCVKCQNSGGFCGYDWISKQPTCHCRDQSCSNSVPDSNAPPGMSKYFC